MTLIFVDISPKMSTGKIALPLTYIGAEFTHLSQMAEFIALPAGWTTGLQENDCLGIYFKTNFPKSHRKNLQTV